MSILIKGMKMPESCYDDKCVRCSFCYAEIGRQYFCNAQKPWGLDVTGDGKNKKHPDCPMEELLPHGRLIDADVMKTKIAGDNDYMIRVLVDWVDSQESVIEAEDGE